MAKPNEEVLSFKVQADVQTAIKRMSQFERDMRKHLQKVTKASEKMAKSGVDAAEDIEDANQSLLASVKDLDTAHEAEAKLIKKLADLYAKKERATEKETAALDEQIKSVGGLILGMKDVKNQFKDRSGSKKMADDLAAAVKKSKELKKGIKDSFKQGFSSFLSKDAKGLTENFGEVLKKGIKLGALGASAKGGKMQQQGAAMKAAGKAQGGLAGFNKTAGGAMTGGVGKLLGGLAKAAPLLITIASVLVKVVTLFLDAEAQAKAFNKQILESASTVEGYGAAMGNVALAGYNLEGALKGIRDAAFSAKTNLDWGITNETHQQVLNTLTQEGVSLQMMARDAQTTGKSMKDFATQVTTVSVAYSRLLGVPITEISQLQGEMVRDMGMGIEETRLAFASMTKEANESGYAANKFFAILRGVSADLSLFNLRIAEAAKFLKQVGKSMSARSGQEFLNTIKGFFKGMGLQERLKAVLVAGVKPTQNILKRDVKRKMTGLTADVEGKIGAGKGKELEVAMKKGADATGDFIAKYSDKLDAGMRESILEAQQLQAKAESSNAVDLASGIADLDPMGVIEQLQAQSMARFGKPLEQLAGTERLAVEAMSNVDDKTSKMIAKFEQGLKIARSEIAIRLKEGKATKEDQALMDRLNITGTDAEKAEKLRHTDSKKIYENMSQTSKKEMEGIAKSMEEYAKEQGDLQTSMVDKLGILVDFVMNELYGVLADILSALPGGGERAAKARASQLALKSGNEELIKIMREGGGKEKLIGSSMGKQVGLILEQGPQMMADLEKKRQIATKKSMEGSTEEERKAGAEEEKSLEAQRQNIADQGVELRKNINTQLKKDKEAGKNVLDILSKEDIKVDEGKKYELTNAIAKGEDIGTALEQAGLSSEAIGKFYAKSLRYISEEQLTGVLGSQAQKSTRFAGGLTGAAPVGEAASTSAQSAASDKAAAPGVSAPAAAPTPAAPTAAAPAAPAAGAGAAATPPGIQIPPPPKAVIDFQDAQLDQLGYLGGQNDDIIKTLKKKVGLNKILFQSDIAPILEESVLNAVRVALVEYKLYKDMDMKDFAELAKDPKFSAKTFGQEALKLAQEGKLTKEYLSATPGEGGTPTAPKPAKPGRGTQTGGHIVGRNPDGTAKILRPPAGEMPAFVGSGETVVPKGGRGGGGGVSVTVNGIGGQDLARMVEVAATDAILKYKRREGLH